MYISPVRPLDTRFGRLNGKPWSIDVHRCTTDPERCCYTLKWGTATIGALVGSYASIDEAVKQGLHALQTALSHEAD